MAWVITYVRDSGNCCQRIMSVAPKELLNKEFLSQFKTEEDVSNFLKELHSQVLEQMLWLMPYFIIQFISQT